MHGLEGLATAAVVWSVVKVETRLTELLVSEIWLLFHLDILNNL
jgi:hypothetical protein